MRESFHHSLIFVILALWSLNPLCKTEHLFLVEIGDHRQNSPICVPDDLNRSVFFNQEPFAASYRNAFNPIRILGVHADFRAAGRIDLPEGQIQFLIVLSNIGCVNTIPLFFNLI